MQQHRSDSRRRRGFGLIEVAISGFLICAALSLTLVGVGVMVRERQTLEIRQRAGLEAQNTLERVLRLPWAERTTDKAKGLIPDARAQQRLSGTSMAVTITDEAGPPAGRKIAIEVHWNVKPGEASMQAPLKLVAWTYPSGSDLP